MSYVDPAGLEKYWLNGAPFAGIQRSNTDGRAEKYWLNGAPWSALMLPVVTSRSLTRSNIDGKRRVASVDFNEVQSGKHRQIALE